VSRPLHIAEAWGRRERWHRFVFPTTRSRSFTQATALRLRKGRVVLVQHGDLECRYSCPPRTGEAPTFYDEPWLNPASAHAYGAGHHAAPQGTRCVALETDLTAEDCDDSIGKLAELLTALETTTGPDDLVLLSSTCLPSKLGDDGRIAKLLGRFPMRSRVLYNDPDVDQAVPPIIEHVARALRASRNEAGPSRDRSVNLIGFPRPTADTSLRQLLGSVGIEVNVELLPDIDLDHLDHFHEAPVSVLFPERHYHEVYHRLFDGVGGRRIAPPPPYGLAGSRRWLTTVAEALGLEADVERAWRQIRRNTLPALEPLAKQLAGQTVGFIGSRIELKSLADPKQTQGVPLFSMLAELGLGAEWLELARPPEPTSTGGSRRRSFENPAELARLIAESRCDLFYSDVAWDGRITRSGKTPISLSSFHPGPEGFIRTARQLVAASRLRFYQEYREYLP